MKYKLAVIGNPIEHSLSPKIFKLFTQNTAINLQYDKILATNKNEFVLQVSEFFQNNGFMLNVTSPFKHEAYLIATYHSELSTITKTANTLYLLDNMIYADTTDGRGLCNDLINNKINLIHKNVLIIGSGYVVESIIPDLTGANLNSLDILARNKLRTDYIIKTYNLHNYVDNKIYDIIINTTPNNATNKLLPIVIQNIDKYTVFYDVSYNHIDNYFMQLAQNNQLYPHYLGGIGMLVEQAKINCEKFFNILKLNHFAKMN
jgi:shikimate dehydrogenase